MRKSIVTLALATLPALVLSACSGTTTGGRPAMMPAVRRDDNGVQDLHAGGADIPAIAYNLGNQPVGYYYNSQAGPGQGSLFYAYGGTGTIYYCLTSSTDGREAFENYKDSGYPPTGPCAPLGDTATGFGGRQDPLDFAASAVALASTECCASGSPYYDGRLVGSETWGQPFEFPQIGGPIVFPFRPQDFSVSSIKLSAWSYCAISNGVISDWNDPAITADNGGKSVTGGNSEAITFYFREDSAGTTQNFTNHLNAACNVTFQAPYNAPPYGSASRSAAWTYGVSSTWPGPGSSKYPNANFIGETGDPGILNAIQSTPYATGYNEGAYAAGASPKVGQALLQNGGSPKKPLFVDPTIKGKLNQAFSGITASDITFGGGSDGNPLASSTPWCQLYIPTSYYVTPAKGYPIEDISYLLFYGQNNGVHVPDKKKLIKFLEGNKAAKLLAPLEYAPLSASVRTAVLTALNGSSNQSACLQ